MTGGLTVAFIRDEPGLAALAPDWWDLWQRSPTATPFQSPGWLIAWWKAFSPGQLLTVAVRMGGRLLGLAPFYVERRGDRARLLPVGISISDYLDVLVDLLAVIARAYELCPEHWQEWELAELTPGALAHRIPVPCGCSASVNATVACPVLSLPRTFRFRRVEV